MIKTIEATPELERVCSTVECVYFTRFPFGNEDHLKVLFVVYFAIVLVILVFIQSLGCLFTEITLVFVPYYVHLKRFEVNG